MSDTEQDENDIIALRREKLHQLKAQGQAYPNDFRRSNLAADLHANFGEQTKEALESQSHQAAVAGRIILKRVMGKASFLTLQDVSGQIQLYVRQEDLGAEGYEAFKKFDMGDILGAEGVLMKTNKGELSVHATAVRLLTKSLRPLPDKHKGLTDRESRYRQRYVDLMVNEETRDIFIKRARIIDFIRHYLIERDYLEVETPMMQLIPGGATAEPFTTHYRALDTTMYFRVAPELNLKRLVVGGFERVFEINRNFRNEGVSTKHSPEFTMLEFYQAYADYHDLIDLTEDLFRQVVEVVLGTPVFEFQGNTIDFTKPFARMTMHEAILAFNEDISAADLDDYDRAKALAEKSGIEVQAGWGLGKLVMEIFEARVEDRIEQPMFVTEYPVEVSPLARKNESNPAVSDRFELYIMGMEVANGFSELNDPEDQAERFHSQVAAKEAGDNEAMHFDEDYINALEYGLPPTAGEGIGIDRLVMLLTNSSSIRDVVLFPHLRKK
ncbi:MAG: lysine--tRNA ligase [Gammaproteobacteria bacterium]|nr:lysine--tRNA ligase [Gammaproteobacteria bacterium]